MKTDSNIKDLNTLRNICENGEEISHLLDNNLTLDDCLLQCSTANSSFENPPMGLKNKRFVPDNQVEVDSRSQSLPDCFQDEKDLKNANIDVVDHCDIEQKYLFNNANPPQSPSSESWFKTWPERCDKLKNNETSPSDFLLDKCEAKNTHSINNCDISIPGNGLSLNEALQNISLAYSPITKQLHLVETNQCKDIDEVDNISVNKHLNNQLPPKVEISEQKKLGHRRIEAGSFSSTVSSISEASTLGSLLDSDERSLSNFEEWPEQVTKKKSFTNFLSRNVFTWKSSDVQNSVGNVWKLFGQKSQLVSSSSPQHVVASSSALIQHARPSNLPAKSVEEEEKHREEYKAILAAARKKQALHSANKEKQEKKQLKQEERLANASKHFTQQVLSNWDAMKTHKKTKELWWQGLPSNVRGKVWSLAIGNELHVTQQLYEICLARAQSRLNSPEPKASELEIDQERSLDLIQLDISRTFPHLGIFQKGGPYSEILHSLLAAYVCYRPDVGYVQGMSYIAAVLILNMEQYNAFICFANLLNQPLHLSAFTLNQSQMQAYYDAFNEIFNYNLPKLYTHFEISGLTPDLYLLDWIYTVFAKAMPLDVACRIWDVFLRDGYEFIFRTALGILCLHQDLLLQMDFVDGSHFLTHLPDNICSDLLFKSIQTISTNIGKQSFCQIVGKHSSVCESQKFS